MLQALVHGAPLPWCHTAAVIVQQCSCKPTPTYDHGTLVPAWGGGDVSGKVRVDSTGGLVGSSQHRLGTGSLSDPQNQKSRKPECGNGEEIERQGITSCCRFSTVSNKSSKPLRKESICRGNKRGF